MPSPKRQPAFQFYAAAWINSASVEMMPPEVEGTYIRLLCRQWLTGELPLDPARLRMLTKLSVPQWRKAWPLLEEHFPITAGGTGRQNPTLASVQREREEFKVQAAESGQRGATKRWGAPSDGEANPTRKRKATTPTDDRVSVGYPTPTLPGPQWGSGSSVSVVLPPSPSPGGEGSSPAAAPLRVLPGGKGNSHSPERSEDPFASGSAIDLEQLLSVVPEVERDAVRTLLWQHSRPAKWQQWLTELARLVGPASQDGPAVTWGDVGQGIRELLLVNEEGRRITLAHVAVFVRAVPRRRRDPQSDALPRLASGPEIDPFQEYCIAQARAGDPAFQAHCQQAGIAYEESA